MRLVIAGASGFLGRAWRDHLAGEGHEVVRLVRRPSGTPSESRWDPYAGHVDPELIETADVVACLSGAPLLHVPWNRAYQRTFTDSRVVPTRTLAEAVARSSRKPALVAQNGIAGYAGHGELVRTEKSDADADTFMAEVTRQWEQAATPAAGAGARVVVMRTAVVLDKRGGAFAPMSLAFKAGLGGPMGSGEQYFSTISLQDWVRAATYLATHDQCNGAYNLSGPHPTTNREFARTLGSLLHRPALIPVPPPAIRLALGAASSEVLGSARVEPARLLEEGFTFEHPTLGDRLRAALS
ncbi:MAG TPA: TIGR01777 family oxidoreductase [Nocardioidaceae bacterium]|nr:TIGR01777 family oxidoreductase [Nocardioidaceae bacterium]